MASHFRPLVFTARLFAGILAAFAAAGCAAADGPWSVAFSFGDSIPRGWVQVRENAIEGSRLGFHDDLGISRVPMRELILKYQLDDDDYWRSSVQSLVIQGTAMPTRNVYFNGTTLLAGKPLSAETGFPDFVRVGILRGHRLATLDNGLDLIGEIGMSFTAINFHIAGTEAPASTGHETKEDFVSQELPVPSIGLRVQYPLSDTLLLTSGLELAWLPWINSGRREGGEVRLMQLQDGFEGGLRYLITPVLAVSGLCYYSYFHQHERSGEDDNNILLETRGVKLNVEYRF